MREKLNDRDSYKTAEQILRERDKAKAAEALQAVKDAEPLIRLGLTIMFAVIYAARGEMISRAFSATTSVMTAIMQDVEGAIRGKLEDAD